MHPILEEICRAKQPPERIAVFRRWQQELARVIAPLVEAGEQAEAREAEERTPRKGGVA